MIYAMSQVSNRDMQLLGTYRILKHNSKLLNAMYRYDDPETYLLENPNSNILDGNEYFEYHIQLAQATTKIPFFEFDCEDENNLKHIEDFAEVEVTSTEVIIRSTADNLTEPITARLYWVLSLKQITDILDEIAKLLGDARTRLSNANTDLENIRFAEKPVINPDSLVPNLVKIGTDEIGLIYDDSQFRLTGTLSEQQLVNPAQSTISSLLKIHNRVLTIINQIRQPRIFQGFSGGILKIRGSFETLVLRDIDSAVMLDGLDTDLLVIDNCQAVIFCRDIQSGVGSSQTVKRMRVRTSNVTIRQPVIIKEVSLWSRALLIQDAGRIEKVGFVDSSSTLCHRDGELDEFAASAIQGTYQSLDLVARKQRQITFPGGQTENPLPIQKVNVKVIVRGGTGGSSGVQPDGRIYTPYTDWYWSGDSRTVGLISVVGCAGQGYGGQGLAKLRQVADEIVSGGSGKNIILWWGVNGLQDGYAEVYEQIAQAAGTNSTVFVATVGRVFNTRGIPDSEDTLGQEGGGGSTTIEAYNAAIATFNENLKTALSAYSDVHVLDVWDYIENTLMSDSTQLELSAGMGNGLHYSSSCYKKIYDWVCSQITNVERGAWADFSPVGESDIMTIYDALRESGYSKFAAIGALANMRHESGWIAHMIGYNSTYFVSYGSRSKESLLDYMNTATSRQDLYAKIQATYDGHSRDRAVGYGLTQFTSTENIGNLFDFHTSTGLGYDTLGVQIPAFKKVLTDNGYWDKMNACASPGDAAYYLCIKYERPRDAEGAANRRYAEANKLASKYTFYD